jgi:hypothetical protein
MKCLDNNKKIDYGNIRKTSIICFHNQFFCYYQDISLITKKLITKTLEKLVLFLIKVHNEHH